MLTQKAKVSTKEKVVLKQLIIIVNMVLLPFIRDIGVYISTCTIIYTKGMGSNVEGCYNFLYTGRVKLPKLSSLCGGNPARTSSSVTIGGDREGLDVEEECVRGREGVDEVGCEREGGSEGVGDGEEESGDSSRGTMED